MKKTFFRMLPVVATGVVLTACNNAEEVKKQTEEQNNKIQQMVDEKLATMQTEADATCTAYVDSLAGAKYDEWYAAESKKPGAKPKPKPKPTTPKTEEPKKEETKGIGKDKLGTEENKGTIGEGKLGTEKTKEEQKLGKGKLGTTPKQ